MTLPLESERVNEVNRDRGAMNEDYFGVCPTCGSNDGYVNVEQDPWFICKEHRVKWLVGSNLFSTWQDQGLGDCVEAALMLSEFEEVAR
jgi:hypothetical protein